MAREFGNKLSRLMSAPRTKTNKSYSVRVIGVPAEWEKHGKAAGPIRNQVMVDMKPDVCLEFNLDNSRGTSNCAQLASAAGIKVVSDKRFSEVNKNVIARKGIV